MTTVEHDPRCISLTDSEFNDHCDCATLRMLDSYTPTMERLRSEYVEMRAEHFGFTDLYAEEWDRALRVHDAEVIDRLADQIPIDPWATFGGVPREKLLRIQEWVHEKAARIRRDHEEA